ncbi:hypothetical protein OAJ57_05475 [Alphaproteobacteria bacterium]|nr:hypothetical protein [Alphaproteobacteria bacterium]
MIICRVFGWILVLTALGAITYEVMAALTEGGWRIVALGEIWFKLHAPSLNEAQAGIQRYVAPWLWEPVITTVLLWPGWAFFGVPGVLAFYFCRKRRRYRLIGKR